MNKVVIYKVRSICGTDEIRTTRITNETKWYSCKTIFNTNNEYNFISAFDVTDNMKSTCESIRLSLNLILKDMGCCFEFCEKLTNPNSNRYSMVVKLRDTLFLKNYDISATVEFWALVNDIIKYDMKFSNITIITDLDSSLTLEW